MSLRSRLASEVAFALNSLTLISMSIRSHPQESGVISFPIARCRDLYEELVDLLEETAFGLDDDEGEEEEELGRPDGTETPSAKGNTTYRQLFRTIVEEAGRVDGGDNELEERTRIARLADEGLTPLRPSDVLISITNILRNFSIADDNAALMGQDRQLLDVLVRIASLPLTTEPRDPTKRWPIRLSPSDAMVLKKDALELVASFGLEVRLEEQTPETAQRVFDLFAFFLLEAHRRDQLQFDLSLTSGSASRIPQPAVVRVARYVDTGLAAFARIALFDSNRIILSRLAPTGVLERLFDSLVRLLPVTEQDFQIMTHESGLVSVENLAMSLYNLAYLAPPDVKLTLRARPAYVRSLMRIVRRLSGSTADPASTAAFQPLTERCLATLHLLSSLSGIAVGSTGIESSDVPWWGLSMSGWDADDEPSGLAHATDGGKPHVRPAMPSEADRGVVKQRLPPSASTAAGLDPGPPILAGETRALFESLSSGALANVFASLTSLL